MYEIFKKTYIAKTGRLLSDKYPAKYVSESDELNFFEECGGLSFNDGLYRTHSLGSSFRWSGIIGKYFQKYKDLIIPFGYDWMGRQLCLDKRRQNYILILDPATVEDFELRQSLILFHEYDLVSDKENALSEEMFRELLKDLNLAGIGYDECLGHKIPLFLGGSDDSANYNKINIEVYWEFQCQIFLQVRDLPQGTKIDSTKFKKG